MNHGFGPLRSPHLPETATPVGWECLHCHEPIAEGDSGEITAYVEQIAEGPPEQDGSRPAAARLVAQHRECVIRHVAGSLGHQLGVCHCPGKPGWMDDPEGLTKRQAAILAERLFMGRRLED
jgi:hypothetical protein